MDHTITAKDWVAMIDRPYYTTAAYFDTEGEAVEFSVKLAMDNHVPDGKYQSIVCVARITRSEEIRTEH